MYYAAKLKESDNLLEAGRNSKSLTGLHFELAHTLTIANAYEPHDYFAAELDTLLDELNCILIKSEKPFDSI